MSGQRLQPCRKNIHKYVGAVKAQLPTLKLPATHLRQKQMIELCGRAEAAALTRINSQTHHYILGTVNFSLYFSTKPRTRCNMPGWMARNCHLASKIGRAIIARRSRLCTLFKVSFQFPWYQLLPPAGLNQEER